MDRASLEALSSGDITKIKPTLQSFNEKNAKLFDFSEFNPSGQWPVIWKAVFDILHNDKNHDVYSECLSCVRILSRDKTYLNSSIDTKNFDRLLKIAGIGPDDILKSKCQTSTNVSVEALKCLCNMVFQSQKCQDMCYKNSACDGILRRVRNPESAPYEIELFDMKLLFLITALNEKTRSRVRDDLNGLTYLTEWLNIKVTDNSKSAQQMELICEILKVLSNIANSKEVDESPSENELEYRRLTTVLRNVLIQYSPGKPEQSEIVSKTVDLLSYIPNSCIAELITFSPTDNQTKKDCKLFEGKCILAVDVLLDFLRIKLQETQGSPAQYDLLAPILKVLVKCVSSDRTLRHFIRSIILPPLKDVTTRPEEGTEIRNYLCRFLTVPQKPVRVLSTELLFVCCKENVGRMIKHTGYGNAAGLFANRGLLGGRSNPGAEYSSDSEDSDTEEYKKLQHGINPVLGCYEPPKPSPFEGMSDEQKEHEAMQLVNLIDKLHKQGIVQPCRIGEDGKPQPVDHILQLQEDIPQQQMDYKKKT